MKLKLLFALVGVCIGFAAFSQETMYYFDPVSRTQFKVVVDSDNPDYIPKFSFFFQSHKHKWNG